MVGRQCQEKPEKKMWLWVDFGGQEGVCKSWHRRERVPGKNKQHEHRNGHVHISETVRDFFIS